MSQDRQRAGAACSDLRPLFQDYLDQTLPKESSLELFLHLRGCAECERELRELKEIYQGLGSLPRIEPPADFDERILASVPYEAYRRMAPLRAPRLPVLLDEEHLPAFLRAGSTRIAGAGLALAVAAGVVAAWLPDWSLLAAAVGVAPEALVRLQRTARRVALRAERSELG